MLTWKTVPRKGFVPRHWVAFDADGKERFAVWQRIEGSRRTKHRYVTLHRTLYPADASTHANLAEAKKAAAQLVP
jgi:hypothetical protein